MPGNTKYTTERVDKILTAIKLGAYYVDACNYAGIDEDTFSRWRKRYADFAVRVKEAEGYASTQWLAKIEAAANDGAWQASAWKLERRYPDRYGRRVKVDATVTVRQEVARLVAAGVIDEDDAEDAIAEAEAILKAAV